MDWVYFATDAKATLSATLGTVLNQQVLWRGAHNSVGRTIANVGDLNVGDRIFVAWRKTAHVYLACTIAAPINPVRSDLVIDVISGDSARQLGGAGYPATSDGKVEVIRLDVINECYFALTGGYGGNNAIHELEQCDAEASAGATTLPSYARVQEKVGDRPQRTRDAARPAKPAGSLSTSSSNLVDSVLIDGDALDRCFDAYVMVDWSSSSKPATQNDSIWIASGAWTGERFEAREPKNWATREEARQAIAETATSFTDQRKRVLVGMDFAFGYSAGFAAALGLPLANGAWRAIHEHFAQEVTDSAQNAHNRDAFADSCNRRIAPSGPGPFWGCTRGAVTSTLTLHRQGIFSFPYAGSLAEWRITDRRAAQLVTTQSVWKLNCGVSVGGQTILGIKYLNDLARHLNAKRWPFETGWSFPTAGQASIWFAEIFPSLVRYPEWEHEYQTRRDRTQVQSCVRRVAELDSTGNLAAAFGQPSGLSTRELSQVVGEEGWILSL